MRTPSRRSTLAVKIQRRLPLKFPKKEDILRHRTLVIITQRRLSETSHSNITDSDKKVNPEEEHRNRSEAMKGNQNAKKDGIKEDEDKHSKVIPELTEKQLNKYVDRMVGEYMPSIYPDRLIEDWSKNWVSKEVQETFSDGFIEELGLSRDIAPTKEELSKALEHSYRERITQHAIEVANEIRNKDAESLYRRCVQVVQHKANEILFGLVTGIRMQGKSEKDRIKIIEEHTGKSIANLILDRKERERKKLLEEAKKEKDQKVINSLKAKLMVDRGEKENQQIAEDLYLWAQLQTPLVRGKILSFFTANKDRRFDITGEYRIGSRIDFVYEMVKAGYDNIESSTKRIYNDEGYFYKLEPKEFSYGVHLVDNKKRDEKIQSLIDVLESEKSSRVTHKKLGEIIINAGKTGKSGYGLAHIIDKHGIAPARKMSEIIEYGKVEKTPSGRRTIKLGRWVIGLKEQWNGKKKTWVVTSFKIGKEEHSNWKPSKKHPWQKIKKKERLQPLARSLITQRGRSLKPLILK